jgi:hypothetical protein
VVGIPLLIVQTMSVFNPVYLSASCGDRVIKPSSTAYHPLHHKEKKNKQAKISKEQIIVNSKRYCG